MKAWELLSDPKRWGRGFLCQKDGEVVPTTYSDDQCKFCIMGAAMKTGRYRGKEWNKMNRWFNDHVGISITGWNDDPNRKHEEVVELLKRFDV